MVSDPALKSPPSDSTRHALLEAATSAFAEHGYAGGSVRAITRAAGANQAAITYHFGGKDELYRAVLREAVAAFEEQSLINETNVIELEPTEALALTMRQFLSPLTQQGRLGRYVNIFGWEGVNPSPVYAAFFAEETPRIFKVVELLVRRFMPASASDQEIGLASFWLVQQPIAFVRNANRLRVPPYGLTFDPTEVDRLVDLLTRLSLGGLVGASRAHGASEQAGR